MRIFLSFCLFLTTMQLFAQETPVAVGDTTPIVEEYVYKEPSKESKAYNAYRYVTTEPSYGLAKVKKAIKAIKAKGDDDPKVSTKVFNSFTAKEKFTYCMIHPESFSQNCDAEPPVEDEQKKIFAYIPDANYEAGLSNRQLDFLKQNKDSVFAWIKETANAKKRVGLNLKEAIVEIKANALIPFLIDFYKKEKKDHDILTVLLLLMEYGKYKPHLQSQMREKLYGDTATWPRFVTLNKANVDLIIKRATEFYNTKK